MTTTDYLTRILFSHGSEKATEHTYRGYLQSLIESIVPHIHATNEPKRQRCGAPDYILSKGPIDVGYIEAKDIGDTDLDGKKKSGNKEQFDRYKAALPNIIFTDYLDFHLYRDGEFVTSISIAEVIPGDKAAGIKDRIETKPENYAAFENLIKEFVTHVSQTITSSKRLAQLMAGKARLLSDVIEKALLADEETDANSTLQDQLKAFKDILIHDITPKGFADVYAQTIAYGMFAARLNDTTMQDFSRQEAAELIPKSNPFLRKLFGYIAGPDIDDRIRWIVDSLAEIFLACDVEHLLKDYGKATRMENPIIHFYETFLSEYDPRLRKARGVWYTPQPVVNFIVRAVDDVLKTEFGLKDGLANTSKTTIKVATQYTDKKFKDNIKKVDKEVHRVQILDPATGTGTFLAEVVRHVHQRFAGQQGIWSKYVEDHLIPRLNGFELLMASYAMAHLQLDMLLSETGYKATRNQRLKVYLTNSLEEHHEKAPDLFASWLSAEADEANKIKRETPVMCVIGNPPYSGESANKGEWIMGLMEDYKKEPGGKEKLKERNPKWINDDYVKFMRYGQHYIEKNGSGVLAFINPHGFLDNPTFRGMRWNLLKTYDKIYTIDLHGNSKKKETAPDGSVDVNVFDIQQGVSINIFVKTGKKAPNELGKVFHYDLYGKRDLKYEFLTKNSLKSLDFKMLELKGPNYSMIERDWDKLKKYDLGFSMKELFVINGNGMVSKRDALAYQITKVKIKEIISYIYNNEPLNITSKFKNISWKSRDGKVEFVKNNVDQFGLDEKYFIECQYRPFDIKWTYYNGESKGFIGWPVKQIMDHLVQENFSISLLRRSRSNSFITPLISKKVIDKCIISTLDNANVFPLYRYPLNTQTNIDGSMGRQPNLNPKIVATIGKGMGLAFVPEKETGFDPEKAFTPIDLLDYIYAVLHSPAYREKYKEFLKIDFPRVPYPTDAARFWELAKQGSRLRQLHLLEATDSQDYITSYPIDGSNEVSQTPKYQPTIQADGTEAAQGKVYINDTQYFNTVPLRAWEFYIGGYQPAQKWLKDRKGRVLSYEDILHYQQIIKALEETAVVMEGIEVL